MLVSATLPLRISSPTTTMPARSAMHGSTSAGVAGIESGRRCVLQGGRNVVCGEVPHGVMAGQRGQHDLLPGCGGCMSTHVFGGTPRALEPAICEHVCRRKAAVRLFQGAAVGRWWANICAWRA